MVSTRYRGYQFVADIAAALFVWEARLFSENHSCSSYHKVEKNVNSLAFPLIKPDYQKKYFNKRSTQQAMALWIFKNNIPYFWDLFFLEFENCSCRKLLKVGNYSRKYGKWVLMIKKIISPQRSKFSTQMLNIANIGAVFDLRVISKTCAGCKTCLGNKRPTDRYPIMPQSNLNVCWQCL